MKKSITLKELMCSPWLVVSFVTATVLAAVLIMATALSVSDFLQIIFPSEGGMASVKPTATTPIESVLGHVYELLAAQGPAKALMLYSVLLFVLYGMKNVCSYLSVISYAGIKVRVMQRLRNRMHGAALRQSFAGWSHQAQGQWLSRMGNDMADYETNVLDNIRSLVAAIINMIIYIFMLLYLDWRMTLLVVVIMVVGTLLLTASRRLRRLSRQMQTINGVLMTTTQETLDSLKEIKAATAIEYVNEKQRQQNADVTRRRTSIYRRSLAASPLSDTIGNIIVVVILLIGAQRVMGDAASLSPALFISYVMIYVLLLAPIKDFSSSIAQIKKGLGVEERIVEAIGEEQSVCGAVEHQSKNRETIESLELRDISFAYGDIKVFDHFNMTLDMHCHTAIVGESGSGKTTLGRILVGLLQPQDGAVIINGKPTKSYERVGRIAYISQEPMLFNDTIEANIRMGREWVTDDDIEEAVRVAQVKPMLRNLPDGLQTVIGDGGGRLSGGERQRINIARALVGNPDIIVMDEATAALDAATEQHFSDELRESMRDRTMVIIAHRASTIARCDKVVRITV